MSETVYGLSANAADGLRNLLAARDSADAPRVGGGAGDRGVFVQCLSATAVGSSGLLAQCYPGRLLVPASDAALPAGYDADGLVLLTLFDSSGNAATPAANAVYLCRLTGSTLGDSAGRPRAFGVGGGAGGFGNNWQSTVPISVDATWQDMGVSVSLPKAGSYLLHCALGGTCWATFAGSTANIYARLYDVTAGAAVDFSTALVAQQRTSGVGVNGSATIIVQLTVTGPTTVRLEGYRDAVTSWTAANFQNLPGSTFQLGFFELGSATGGAQGPTGATGADGATIPDSANSVIGMSVFGF